MGMMAIFERAGLIKPETSVATAPESSVSGAEAVANAPVPTAGAITEVRAGGPPLDLAGIYANEGVPGSSFPAERLARLIDGLSALDEPVRRTAVAAMDAADETWSIEDPLADAKAKIKALAVYSERLLSSLQQLDQETKARSAEVRGRCDGSVGSIRKQIEELEALASRELARAEGETAEFEATLNTAKAQTLRQLEEIKKTSEQLQTLVTQFGTPVSPSKG